jgi:hypothetical protein
MYRKTDLRNVTDIKYRSPDNLHSRAHRSTVPLVELVVETWKDADELSRHPRHHGKQLFSYYIMERFPIETAMSDPFNLLQ